MAIIVETWRIVDSRLTGFTTFSARGADFGFIGSVGEVTVMADSWRSRWERVDWPAIEERFLVWMWEKRMKKSLVSPIFQV